MGIWARLRFEGLRTSKDRVLRLLRQHQLLSPWSRDSCQYSSIMELY
jgi:hypothetical protein